MATTSSNELAENLERLVADFVREAQQMVLAAVAQSLVTSASGAASSPSTTTKSSERTRPSKRAKSSKRAKPGPRRTSAQLDELGERFHEVLRDHPGETMAVLAAKVGCSADELRHPVKRLRRAGRVRTVGQRQSMRYFPTLQKAEAA